MSRKSWQSFIILAVPLLLVPIVIGCAGSSHESAESAPDPGQSAATDDAPSANPGDNTGSQSPLTESGDTSAAAMAARGNSLDEAIPEELAGDEPRELAMPQPDNRMHIGPLDNTPPHRAVEETAGPELLSPRGDPPLAARDDQPPRLAPMMVDPNKRSAPAVPAVRPSNAFSANTGTVPMVDRSKSNAVPTKMPHSRSAAATTMQDRGKTDAVPTAPATSSSAPYTLVKVFYATDRQQKGAANAVSDHPWYAPAITSPLAGVGVTLMLLALGVFRKGRRLFWGFAMATSFVTVAWAGVWFYAQWPQYAELPKEGVRYGNDRGELQVGSCVVSIPKNHQIGQVEAPSILHLEVRENVRKHVVLQRTDMASSADFYNQLQHRVQQSDGREVFVFVHGYNVTFADAARRTAQIAHDVRFAGAPIFFSWPSQGGLLKYTIDETNVSWAVPHLKQFLLDVVNRSGARSVNLIAHSMGNRALTRALRELELELRDEATLFNQVILAAPDVDAEIFRRDLAPALLRTARHVTLYASSNDQALAASKRVHGYPRAGESGVGLVVIPGIDTIDVSKVDTSFLGHSYYGSSNPILQDIYLLIHDAMPPANRRWLQPASFDGLTYWVFQQAQRTATRTFDDTGSER